MLLYTVNNSNLIINLRESMGEGTDKTSIAHSIKALTPYHPANM